MTVFQAWATVVVSGRSNFVDLFPGDLIGRLWNAALQVNDARVSEAHAMISLRSDGLVLLSLRGRLKLHGLLMTEVVLEPGLRVELAEGLFLDVEEVALPESVLGIEGVEEAVQPLSGRCSIVDGALEAGFVDGAEVHIWSTGEHWFASVQGAEAERVGPGSVLLDELRIVELPRHTRDTEPTRVSGSSLSPMTLRARYETVHLFVEGRAPLALDGQQARLVSELVAYGCPVPWKMVANRLWEEEDPDRERWDRLLYKLRRKLKRGGFPPDLVRSGGGNVELVVRPEDQVIDES